MGLTLFCTIIRLFAILDWQIMTYSNFTYLDLDTIRTSVLNKYQGVSYINTIGSVTLASGNAYYGNIISLSSIKDDIFTYTKNSYDILLNDLIIYTDNLIEYLNYTKSIFQYLDRFYMIEDKDVSFINTIKKILKELIDPLIKYLTLYKDDLNFQSKGIKSSLEEEILQLRPLYNLDMNDNLSQLKKTDDYDEYYWEILTSVDTTIKTINELDFIQAPAINVLMRNLGEISTNINLFIVKLQNEITKMNKPRTTVVKGRKIQYKTMEEKKNEERRQGLTYLDEYQKLPRVLPEGTSQDSSLELDYSKNLDN
jgi:hypothetical protein